MRYLGNSTAAGGISQHRIKIRLLQVAVITVTEYIAFLSKLGGISLYSACNSGIIAAVELILERGVLRDLSLLRHGQPPTSPSW